MRLFWYFTSVVASLVSVSSLLLRGHPVWSTHDNLVYRGSDVFRIRGINWNGFESDCLVMHGLWAHPIDHYLDILDENGFNAVRIPVAFETMDNLDLVVHEQCTSSEPSIPPGTTVRAALGTLLDKLRDRGISALIDLHTIGGTITEFPWTEDVDERRVVAAWTRFADAFGSHPALFGLEIKNEPHGDCTTAVFHRHVAKVVAAIGDRFQGLYFVSGTSDTLPPSSSSSSSFLVAPPWGGTFEKMESGTCDALCSLHMSHRLVFAPHVYGPDVRGPDVQQEGDVVFDQRFGFLNNHSIFHGSAIVPTEFGGHLRGDDLAYFERWRDYMRTHNMTAGGFFWTLPPTSQDTGGLLLDDFQTVDADKLAFLQRL